MALSGEHMGSAPAPLERSNSVAKQCARLGHTGNGAYARSSAHARNRCRGAGIAATSPGPSGSFFSGHGSSARPNLGNGRPSFVRSWGDSHLSKPLTFFRRVSGKTTFEESPRCVPFGQNPAENVSILSNDAIEMTGKHSRPTEHATERWSVRLRVLAGGSWRTPLSEWWLAARHLCEWPRQKCSPRGSATGERRLP
jgi:hypothetical protein